ncbi:MAG: PilN domain-containing protein [Proteobacteria bacterium]|nr:PilN domain-containing protein [Pseudomonadota bacterium]
MIKINLLPGKAKKDLLKIDIYLFFSVMIINFMIFGGIYYINAKDISNYKAQIENAKKEIANLQSVYKEYLAMEQEKKEIQRRIKAIDGIKEGRALSPRILYDLTSVIKDNVWLKSFRKTDDKFELDGRSLENESISALVESLSKIPYIKNIELKNVQDIIEEGITVKQFSISGDLVL